MRKSFVFLVLAFLAAFAPKADAALILAADINGNPICAADNDIPCFYGVQLEDQNPAEGILSLDTTTIGGVTVEGSLHTSSKGVVVGDPTS